jgi:hypothetical protein
MCAGVAPWKAQLAAMAMLTRLAKTREFFFAFGTEDIRLDSSLSNRIDGRGEFLL